MRLDQTYHGYHFLAEKLAFSMYKTKITPCVLINFSHCYYFRLRLSFSEEAEAIIEKITVTGKDDFAAALCVLILIKHLMAIVF